MDSRRTTILGTMLILLGLAFAVLPKDWIEQNLGVEPDGGSGALELLFVLVPIVIGVGLVATSLVRARGSSSSALDAGDGSAT